MPAIWWSVVSALAIHTHIAQVQDVVLLESSWASVASSTLHHRGDGSATTIPTASEFVESILQLSGRTSTFLGDDDLELTISTDYN
jgi:hypothetical protein